LTSQWITDYVSRVPPAAPRESATAEVLDLLRTVDVVRRFLTRVVEPQGITLQQFNVLRILRGAERASPPIGLPTLDIAERMVERAPGITRLLDRLEAKGLAVRKRCPEDRRQVLCRITAAGLELLARLDGPMARADSDCLGMLSASDLRRLTAILGAIRTGHAALSPEP
jgi:DNA-binding MarR family transcriptional regulator